MNREVGTWHKDVGKHTGRTAEHVVFKLHALIDGNVVLDAHAVAYLDLRANVDILPQRAVLAQNGTLLDMAEMPHLGAAAYLDAIVDIGTLVYENIVYHPKGCCVIGYLAMG